MFFEKTKYLAGTYKSGSLSVKLPKRTMYYKGVYFILKSIFLHSFLKTTFIIFLQYFHKKSFVIN